MDDLSKLSDDELMALYNKGQQSGAAAGAAAPTPSTDLSKMSDDELKAAYNATSAAPAKRTVGQDIAIESGKGLGRGLATAVGDVGEVLAGPFGPSHTFRNLMSDIGLADKPAAEPAYSAQITKAAGLEPTPQTPYGRYAGTAAEFVGNPESYVGPGGVIGKVITAAGSGLGSEAAGDVGEKFAPDSPKTQAAMKLIGAIAGGHVTAGTPRLVTPLPSSPEREAMVATLRNEGVPLTAGDRTGSTQLKAAESELSAAPNEAQNHAFQQAAFNRVGETIGDRPITGQTGAVNTMMTRIGRQFDDLSSRNTLAPDQRLVQDLRDVHDVYNSTPGLYPQETVNSVNGSIDRVMNSLFGHGGTGAMSGADYQTLRSNLRRAAQGATDPQRAEGLHEVVNALDDAMERSIQRTNPSDAGAWARARRDYQNGLVLERWAGSANMTPATLAQAAKAVYGKRQYVRGLDDFSDLADAGRNVLKQYQDSGTARRTSVENVLRGVGGLLGYMTGQHTGMSEGGVGGLLVGENAAPILARPLVRRALMNPVTQTVLGNQIIPQRIETSPSAIALINEMRGGEVPPAPNARKAKDGKWYIPDSSRPGKYLEVRP